jgi:hypothetical protein
LTADADMPVSTPPITDVSSASASLLSSSHPTGLKRRPKKASYKALSNLAVAAEKEAAKKDAETRKSKRDIEKHLRQTLTQNEG